MVHPCLERRPADNMGLKLRGILALENKRIFSDQTHEFASGSENKMRALENQGWLLGPKHKFGAVSINTPGPVQSAQYWQRRPRKGTGSVGKKIMFQTLEMWCMCINLVARNSVLFSKTPLYKIDLYMYESVVKRDVWFCHKGPMYVFETHCRLRCVTILFLIGLFYTKQTCTGMSLLSKETYTFVQGDQYIY